MYFWLRQEPKERQSCASVRASVRDIMLKRVKKGPKESKQACKQAGKHASRQASKQASRKASKQEVGAMPFRGLFIYVIICIIKIKFFF